MTRCVFVYILVAEFGGCGGTSIDAGEGGVDATPDAMADAAIADVGVPDRGPIAPRDAAGIDRTVDGEAALGAPYPLVLAHGFFGFDDFAGAGFLTYFYQVEEDLRANGEQVFITTVDPFNDSTVRGLALLERVEEILAETGHAKVNLIGHSQGGLDARVVAAERPDLVESVTTIATPHDGTLLADIVVGLVEDDRLAGLLDAFVRLIGAPLYDQVGMETSVVAALRQLSTDGGAEFNRRYPDPPGVAIYSIGGRSDRHRGRRACVSPSPPPFIARWEDETDPIDPLLGLTEEILDGGLTAPFPNDGLVRVDDAKRGRFLGCVPADHLDQVGQLLGDSPGLFNDFDHQEFFRELAAWLRSQGH
ncbi:MAG: triacylglycerol lipase [Myxococcota bacterium]